MLTYPGLTSEKRRRAQNRASQRAFRARKDRYMKELEGKLKDTVIQLDKLRAEYDAVVAAHEREVNDKATEEKEKAQIALKIAICKKCFSGKSGVQSIQVGFENHNS